MEAGPAERLAFEHLDPVDVSFDDAGVPGQRQAGDDRIAVSVDSGRESVEALRDQTTVLAGALTEPEGDGFRAALRTAVRSLPALVAGTAVQQTGEALVTAIRQLLG